ncbi:MAG: methyltransferase [Crocinitomicaceae bacterium]|nr:methyltransferase [Crocinitomicaceae bacterium]
MSTDKKEFRKQFWSAKKMVGSITPSSRYLTKKMLENIDFNNTKVIVELGPGTGVFTTEIITKMSKDTILLVFEVNDCFYNNLNNTIKDERVYFIHDSAEKIEDYLSKYNLDKADIVISSLPLAVFPSELREKILKSSKRSLNNHGKYIQFQYSLQSKALLKNLFNQVKISFTPFNFPPAFVYTCSK